MEFIETKAATKDAPAERVAIPDVVVSASIGRDLVHAYVSASPGERAAIEATAAARVAPSQPVDLGHLAGQTDE